MLQASRQVKGRKRQKDLNDLVQRLAGLPLSLMNAELVRFFRAFSKTDHTYSLLFKNWEKTLGKKIPHGGVKEQVIVFFSLLDSFYKCKLSIDEEKLNDGINIQIQRILSHLKIGDFVSFELCCPSVSCNETIAKMVSLWDAIRTSKIDQQVIKNLLVEKDNELRRLVSVLEDNGNSRTAIVNIVAEIEGMGLIEIREDVVKAIDELLISNLQLPEKAPELYKNRENKKETPPEFLQRVWGEYLQAEVLFQDNLRSTKKEKFKNLDPQLMTNLSTFCTNNGLQPSSFVPKMEKRLEKRLEATGSEQVTEMRRRIKRVDRKP